MKFSFSSIALTLVGLSQSSIAATTMFGDPTTNLTSTLFVDDAAIGGGDFQIIEGAFTQVDIETFAGVSGSGAGTIAIDGFGWASPGNIGSNVKATQIDLRFIYLGANGIVGGGDDVIIGDVNNIDNLAYSVNGAGTFYVEFDSAISASIDGANDQFQVLLNVDNIDVATDAIRFKNATGLGPKLTVSGSFTPVPEPGSTSLLAIALALPLMRRTRNH